MDYLYWKERMPHTAVAAEDTAYLIRQWGKDNLRFLVVGFDEKLPDGTPVVHFETAFRRCRGILYNAILVTTPYVTRKFRRGFIEPLRQASKNNPAYTFRLYYMPQPSPTEDPQ